MILAALLGAAAYAPSIGNWYVYDDYPVIVDNPLVNQPGPWYRFWLNPYWPRGTSPDKLYRPLAVWSFRADLVLSGQQKVDPHDARVCHTINVILHALTCVGTALLAWRVTRRPWAAWLAGALFATHPLHTETVVTGYGRCELLAGMFAVWLMARYLRPDPVDSPGLAGAPSAKAISKPRATFHLVNTLLLLLAVMSKEHALFVWPVLVLYDVFRYRHMDRASRPPLRQWLNDVAAPAHAGFVLAIATYFFCRFAVFGQFYWLASERVRVWESPMAHANFVEHLFTPFRLFWLTWKLAVWPPALCPVWAIPATQLADHLALDVIGGILLVVLLLAAGAWLWRRCSPMSVIVAGMLILLAIPTQALPMAHWLFAERWLYLPSVLMAVLVAAMLARIPVAGWSVGLTAALVVLPASWQYSSKFVNNMTMAREIVARQPNNFKGQCYLATHLYLEGRYEDAIRVAQDMIERFGTGISEPYAVLMQSYLKLGKGREGLAALEKFEWIRRDIPEPSPAGLREQLEALIAVKSAESRPATDSAPATHPDG